jgi:hypothetical protein
MKDHADPRDIHAGERRLDYLAMRGIDRSALHQDDARNLLFALIGFHVTPPVSAGSPPVNALVWLTCAMAADGRYRAPEDFHHSAELGDGGPLIDVAVLMAVVQRQCLPETQPGWDDARLSQELGVAAADLARAQLVLDHAAQLTRRNAPLGAGWWERSQRVR